MNTNHPSKEQVRAYLAQRGHAHLPPPSPEEIRRRLDWRAEPAADGEPVFLSPAMVALAATLAVAWFCWPLVLAKSVQK